MEIYEGGIRPEEEKNLLTPSTMVCRNLRLDKRARLDGEIKKAKVSMARAQALIDELSEIESDPNAIDQAMQLHELQIDVVNIDPIRSQYVRVEISYVELTRALLSSGPILEAKVTMPPATISFPCNCTPPKPKIGVAPNPSGEYVASAGFVDEAENCCTTPFVVGSVASGSEFVAEYAVVTIFLSKR